MRTILNKDDFEFTDDAGWNFKVKKMEAGDYWLWRKLKDGRFMSIRKLSNASFNDEPTEVDKMYERHCEQVNPRR